jgi:hypothetical protein
LCALRFVSGKASRLHIFMPPVAATESYLDLITDIETAVTNWARRSSSKANSAPRPAPQRLLYGQASSGQPSQQIVGWLVERTTVL